MIKLATMLFRDTIAARMLRLLFKHGEMEQALFMREYMQRCARKPTGWCKRGKVNSSSFTCNFGRFIVTPRIKHRWNGSVIEQMARPDMPSRNILRWVGPSWQDFAAALTDKQIEQWFTALETQLLSPRAPDLPDDHSFWMVRLRGEIDRRLSELDPTRRQMVRDAETPPLAA
jgi:hypothetical protein